MHALTEGPPSPRLASAFLALCDLDRESPARARSCTLAALAAVLASALLAFSAPLAWLSGPVARPSDLPPATQASKAAVPAPDDDADGGG
jgi:hypothetical protein